MEGKTYMTAIKSKILDTFSDDIKMRIIEECKILLNQNEIRLPDWLAPVNEFFPDKYKAFIDDLKYNTSHVRQYYLLKEYSDKINGKIILDIGTDRGLSAFILGLNGKNKVISYDIIDFNRDIKNQITNKYPNIEFRIENLLYDTKKPQELFMSSSLILVDTDPHDGKQEQIFYELIKGSNFNGITIWDDIHLNQGMEKFWNNIIDKKEDLSHIAHNTGTGLIEFL